MEKIETVLGQPFTLLESELHEGTAHGVPYRVCSHGLCDGSGYTKVKKDGHTFTSWCQCHRDRLVETGLKQSRIEDKYKSATLHTMDERGTSLSLLKPRRVPLDKVEKVTATKGKKTPPKPDDPNEYIERHYETRPQPSANEFFQKYARGSLRLLATTPRENTMNLLLFGEPGCGKTFGACALGLTYLRNGRSVRYTHIRSLLDSLFDHREEVEHMVRTVDLLILDEIGQEYHTDTHYALKELQKIFKIRHDNNLPIVITTNFYPNELVSLYGKSIVSMLHGDFFLAHMSSPYDYRLDHSDDAYNAFDF